MSDREGGRLIFVGTLHCALIVAEGDHTATHILPRWRPTPDVATLLASRITDLDPNQKDTVILDLLSNSFLMGCYNAGMPVKVPRDSTGYHLMGGVEGSPTSTVSSGLEAFDRS